MPANYCSHHAGPCKGFMQKTAANHTSAAKPALVVNPVVKNATATQKLA